MRGFVVLERLMPEVLEQLVGQVPPVTKGYIFVATLLMILCTLDVLSPYALYLNWSLVLEGQWWRLVTCFFFYGPFGLAFFWNMYILVFYCSSLEEIAFQRQQADFTWMLYCSGGLLLVLSLFVGQTHFFGGAMIDVMTYLWGRRNPSARMMVLFFTVRAPYLPWVLAGVSMLMGGAVQDHLLGIFVGHTYYFFHDVYPLMPTSNGINFFRTPKLLKTVMGQRD